MGGVAQTPDLYPPPSAKGAASYQPNGLGKRHIYISKGQRPDILRHLAAVKDTTSVVPPQPTQVAVSAAEVSLATSSAKIVVMILSLAHQDKVVR
jgi:hypothetical protein